MDCNGTLKGTDTHYRQVKKNQTKKVTLHSIQWNFKYPVVAFIQGISDNSQVTETLKNMPVLNTLGDYSDFFLN